MQGVASNDLECMMLNIFERFLSAHLWGLCAMPDMHTLGLVGQRPGRNTHGLLWWLQHVLVFFYRNCSHMVAFEVMTECIFEHRTVECLYSAVCFCKVVWRMIDVCLVVVKLDFRILSFWVNALSIYRSLKSELKSAKVRLRYHQSYSTGCNVASVTDAQMNCFNPRA